MDQTSDSEQCSNQLKLDLILILINFSYKLEQIGGSLEKKSGTKNLIRFYIALNWGEVFKVAEFGDIALCSKECRAI